MNVPIIRRDFVNGVLAAAVASAVPRGLLPQAETDEWTGPGGVGDYAVANGNTREVVDNAHRVRDGGFRTANVVDADERYDLVVVGAGFAGLSAAYRTRQLGGEKRTCLVIDNHRIFGGEAKRNEFVVDGHRLLAPQGSNDFVVPSTGWRREDYDRLGIPTTFSYREPPTLAPQLEFCRDHYMQLRYDQFEGNSYFFAASRGGDLIRNPWEDNLARCPWPSRVRDDLVRARTIAEMPYQGDQLERWLDGRTYEEYLVGQLRLDPAVPRFIDPHLAAIVGLGCDVISACTAFRLAMPGFAGYAPERFGSRRLADLPPNLHAYPGGNDGLMRHYVKALLPDAIDGNNSPENIHEGRIRFDRLDRPGNPVRFRLGATVGRIEDRGDGVSVTYLLDGTVRRVRARAVVLACGGWIAKHVVADLPPDHRRALDSLVRAPILVANVALRNWRPMARLGVSAIRWFEGLGFSCNLRLPMTIGSYQPEFHPDRPAVLTFYIPFCFPGRGAAAQAIQGRTELLGRSYHTFERMLRRQMVTMLGAGGFDPARDIAGIVLNRWGHAYVVPTPGFYFAGPGARTASDTVRDSVGPIAFAHSELTGHQTWGAALTEGRRAADQVEHLI